MARFIALLTVILGYVIAGRPVAINGSSMYPAYKDGQYFMINKLEYKNHNPDRGEVVVYKRTLPTDNSEVEFIGRIIGLPGEQIKLSNGKVYINNTLLQDDYSSGNPTKGKSFLKDNASVTVPTSSYAIFGDNREFSADSREFGFVEKSAIIGKLGKCYTKCN